MEKKFTKTQILEVIAANVENMVFEEDYVSAADVTAYVKTTLAQMGAKKIKAAEKRAEKKVESDALMDTVLAHVTNEFATAEDITASIDDAEVTKGKVVNRLSKLVANGLVTKEQVKTEAGKRMAYRLVDATIEG